MKKCNWCGENTTTSPMCGKCLKNTIKGQECRHKNYSGCKFRNKIYDVCDRCGYMRTGYMRYGPWKVPSKLTKKELGEI